MRVELDKAFTDRLKRGLLHSEVQAGVDLVVGAREDGIAKLIDQNVLNVIDKVGSLRVIERGTGLNFEGFGLGLVPFLPRDRPGLGHHVQNKVPAGFGLVGIANRRVSIGRRNDACQGSRFPQRKIFHTLVKVSFCRLSESDDAEGPPLPEIDIIAVQFENLLLGEALFQQYRHVGIRQLTLPGPLRRQEVVLHKLLC